MNIDTSYMQKCILALDKSQARLQQHGADDIEYEIYRSAIVKEFEIILEQAGNLLKKYLKPYFHTPKAVDKLVFKDIFREAGKFDVLSLDEVQRWLHYRDSRNSTTHNYGAELADETLSFIKQFITDATNLAQRLNSAS